MSPTVLAVMAVVVVPVLGGARTSVLKSNRMRQMLPFAGQMVYMQFLPGARLLLDTSVTADCSMKVMFLLLLGEAAEPVQVRTSVNTKCQVKKLTFRWF